MSEFGEKIKNLRTEKELTVKEACKRVGIPQSRLSELERGVRLPTEGQVNILEQYYEVDPGTLGQLATADEALSQSIRS